MWCKRSIKTLFLDRQAYYIFHFLFIIHFIIYLFSFDYFIHKYFYSHAICELILISFHYSCISVYLQLSISNIHNYREACKHWILPTKTSAFLSNLGKSLGKAHVHTLFNVNTWPFFSAYTLAGFFLAISGSCFSIWTLRLCLSNQVTQCAHNIQYVQNSRTGNATQWSRKETIILLFLY